MNQRPHSPTLCGLLAIILWSATYALARSISEQIGSLTAGACVYWMGGTFGLIYAWKKGKRISHFNMPLKYLAVCGGLFVFYMICTYLAIGKLANRHQLLEIALINYLWPSLTILFSLFILRKRAGWWIAPGIALAITGAVLAIFQGTEFSLRELSRNVIANPLAYFITFLAAISWALYSNFTRKWQGQDSSTSVTIFMLCTAAALTILCLFFPAETNWTAKTAVEVILLGISVTLAYICWDIGMKKGDATLIASCAYFTPVLSTIVSCLYLGILAGWKIWAACACVITGSILCKTSVKKSPSEASEGQEEK